MTERPNDDFARAWYISYAMAGLLTFPIEWWWAPWAAFASWFAVFMFGYFAGAELVSGGAKDGSGTKTEFTRYRVKWEALRFLMGVWLSLLVMYRFPRPWNWWMGGALMLWLPLHLATAFEKKLARWVRERIFRITGL